MSLSGIIIEEGMVKSRVIEFLRESNAIEGVYDEDSLVQAEAAFAYLLKQKVMTPSVVCNTHKILMTGQGLYADELGAYRRVAVYIGGKAALMSLLIPERMDEWCKRMNNPALVEHWKEMHVEYEKIHPFVDGNGRTGRMFMNWQRIRAGLHLHIIHEGAEQREYYGWFKDKTNNNNEDNS